MSESGIVVEDGERLMLGRDVIATGDGPELLVLADQLLAMGVTSPEDARRLAEGWPVQVVPAVQYIKRIPPPETDNLITTYSRSVHALVGGDTREHLPCGGFDPQDGRWEPEPDPPVTVARLCAVCFAHRAVDLDWLVLRERALEPMEHRIGLATARDGVWRDFDYGGLFVVENDRIQAVRADGRHRRWTHANDWRLVRATLVFHMELVEWRAQRARHCQTQQSARAMWWRWREMSRRRKQ